MSVPLTRPVTRPMNRTSPVARPVALRPRSLGSPASGPTRLRVPDLLYATDQAADDVLSGRCDHLLPEGGIPRSRRWFTRIHGDDELDVWLISWVPGHHTELHDHCGSLGALTVVSGSLNEFRWDGTGLRCRRLDAGDQAGFPLGWVHDVVWAPRLVTVSGPRNVGAAPPEHAVKPSLSVHAYSPPLTAMSYYEVTNRNTLRRQRTELTDQPEGP
jgi:Cysteine dioxygenase type I